MLVYYNPEELQKLSLKEFIKRYILISEKVDLVKSRSVSQDIVAQVSQMFDLYEAEMDRRREEGDLDDDDIDDIYEQAYFEIEEDRN